MECKYFFNRVKQQQVVLITDLHQVIGRIAKRGKLSERKSILSGCTIQIVNGENDGWFVLTDRVSPKGIFPDKHIGIFVFPLQVLKLFRTKFMVTSDDGILDGHLFLGKDRRCHQPKNQQQE